MTAFPTIFSSDFQIAILRGAEPARNFHFSNGQPKDLTIRFTIKMLTANKQFLVDTGGVINSFISSDTIFYVTQTLYNTESPVVPIKIRYKNSGNLNQSFTICEGQTIAVGDTIYRTSGIFTKRFVVVGGCDSLVTTKLTVKIPPKIQNTFNLCAGEAEYINGESVVIGGDFSIIR